jgi:hypothetical protein
VLPKKYFVFGFGEPRMLANAAAIISECAGALGIYENGDYTPMPA